MSIEWVYVAVVGYLLGSIPFGLILTRMAGLGDVRKIGSGNIGATNVLRTGNKPLAAATLVLDAAKAAAAVIIAQQMGWGPYAPLIAAVAAFIGHSFPVWLNFKGGKGVATYIGALLALNLITGILFCVVWLIMAAGRKISSLAALTAAVTAPVFAYLWSDGDWALVVTCTLISAMLIVRHSANIRRLIKGDEPRIGAS